MLKILLKLKWYLRHSTKIETIDEEPVVQLPYLQRSNPRVRDSASSVSRRASPPLRFSFRAFCRPSPLPDPPYPYIILCSVPATSPRLRQPCPCPRVGHNDRLRCRGRRRPPLLSPPIPAATAAPQLSSLTSCMPAWDMGTWGFFGFSSWPLTVTSRGFACRYAFCNERSRSWRNSAVEEINDSDVGKPIKALLSGQWWQRQDNNRHCFLSAGQLERSFSGACVDRQPASVLPHVQCYVFGCNEPNQIIV